MGIETGRLGHGIGEAVMRAAPSVALVLALVAGSAACAKPKAKVIPDVPMEIPLPPPRIVETADTPSAPPVGLISEPPRAAPDRPRSTAPARPEPRVEAPRPEPSPGRQDEGTRASALQTTPVEREGAVEQQVRALLTKASRDLQTVDYRLLDRDARTQYDTARRFIDQAEEAAKGRNFVLAGTLADKAATLASQLGGR